MYTYVRFYGDKVESSDAKICRTVCQALKHTYGNRLLRQAGCNTAFEVQKIT